MPVPVWKSPRNSTKNTGMTMPRSAKTTSVMNNVRFFTSCAKSHRTKNHCRTAIKAAVSVIHKNPTGGGKSEPSSMMTLAIKKKAADSIHEIDLIFTFTLSYCSEHYSAFLFYHAFHERVNTNPAITVGLTVSISITKAAVLSLQRKHHFAALKKAL